MFHSQDSINTAQGYTGPTQAIPPKPATLNLDLFGIPTRLTQRDQWVLWRWEKVKDKHGRWKWTKVPIAARTGEKASTTNPDDWAPFSVVLHYLKVREGQVDGIGYVFADDFTGIDLDDAYDPETHTLAPWAQAIVDRFDSFTEQSITGTGVHIIVEATVPEVGGNRKGSIEAYSKERFFVMSGHTIRNGGYIGDRQDELDCFHRETFPEKYAPKPAPRPASTEPLSVDDDELLQACTGNPKFVRLQNGDDSDYPDGEGRTNTSDADLGFLGVIVRNGGTRSQAEDFLRRFRYRPKLDNHRTYVAMTLDKAFNGKIVPFDRGPRLVAHQSPTPSPHPAGSSADATELERLRVENATLRAEVEEKKRTISNLVHTFLNPNMVQSEKLALISSINFAEQKRDRGDVRPDGSVELSAAEIARDWRPEPKKGESVAPTNRDGSKPLMPRSSAKDVMETIVDRGIVQATPRTITRLRANGAPYQDTVWDVVLPEKLSDILAAAAAYKPEEPKVRKVRSRAQVCPHCGEVHPIKRVDYCGGCGSVRAERTITPVEQEAEAETDELRDPEPVAADDAGKVIRQLVESGSVAGTDAGKTIRHSRPVVSTPQRPALIAPGRSSPQPTAPPPAYVDSVPF